MPLLNIAFGVAFMLAIGGSVMAGKFLGEKNPEAASAIFTRVLLVQIGLGVLVLVLMLGLTFFDSLIFLLGAAQGVEVLVAEYLVVLLWAMPIFMAGMAFVIEAAVNILLDWLFIVEFEWGLSGAAWATTIAYSTAILVLAPTFLPLSPV